MAMVIVPSALSLSNPPPSALASVQFLSNGDQFMASARLSIGTLNFRESKLTIRMGGGPRTYPGGVSKWQWKRMQTKKAKQLLKARLCRERQIYEMRKRAELKAAISELERPWEVVDKAPTLFSVKADEQVKVLADRFQRPGGFDMWSEEDGPQILRPFDGLPSTRFFPKGVVHSVKPYGVVPDSPANSSDEDDLQFDDWIARGKGGTRRMRRSSRHRGSNLPLDDDGIREKTESSASNGANNRPSRARSKGSEVPRLSSSGSHLQIEGRAYLTDQRKMDSDGSRKPRNSNFRGPHHRNQDSDETYSAKHRNSSGRNRHVDNRSSPERSLYNNSRNNLDRRYPHEKEDEMKLGRSDMSNGLRVAPVTMGRSERVKMKMGDRESVTSRGLIAGRNQVQKKSSSDGGAYRRKIYNWGEDDNF